MHEMKELVQELVNCGMSEMIIRSVFIGLETKEQYKQMTDWLREVNHPTMNDIMIKVALLTEE